MEKSKLKKYFDKYFKSQYIKESDIEFKALVKLLDKKENPIQIDALKSYGFQTYQGYFWGILHNYDNNQKKRAEEMFKALPKEQRKLFLYELFFGGWKHYDDEVKVFFLNRIY